MIEPIATTRAPAAIGPYSQAIKSGNLLFVSGQLPLNPTTGEIETADAVEQAKQCLRNLQAIVEEAGADLSHVVKTTVLLTDLGTFVGVNQAYGSFFAEPFPARACYEVKALPKGARVEIEAIVALTA